jgi:hypothetical protein
VKRLGPFDDAGQEDICSKSAATAAVSGGAIWSVDFEEQEARLITSTGEETASGKEEEERFTQDSKAVEPGKPTTEGATVDDKDNLDMS